MASKSVLLQIKEFIKEYRKNFTETEEVMNLHKKTLVAIMNFLDKENEEKISRQNETQIQKIQGETKYEKTITRKEANMACGGKKKKCK